jgi:UDP-N-acetylmuramoyl-L-alanyl-D-glutamate--2,6-diaminopimelate ligase
MRWNEIRLGVEVESFAECGNPEITSVAYDSRRACAGSLFVAMHGGTVDGNHFIEAALHAGATAIVTEEAAVYESLQARGVACALVLHGRHALAQAATMFYGAPQKLLKITAITGTNGKTTTAFLLEQLLQSVGRKVLLIGTIATRMAGVVRESIHTTPEASDLIALFAEAVAAGCTEVVMEASSHALEQGRMWTVPVDVAVFTNLTQDHLDFHGSMEAYAAAKAKLFSAEGTGIMPRVAVLRSEDEYSQRMGVSFRGEMLVRYGRDETCEPEWLARDVRIGLGRTAFEVQTAQGSAQVDSPLSGEINVENLLAAMCAAQARGLTLEQAAAAVPKLKPAPGRFEAVSGGRAAGISVVVDYAHTPDALENVCAIARGQIKAPARVMTVFGCGGDRDRTKRPKMGRAAGAGSDFVVVTSDNPRSEDPAAIVEEILPGLLETGCEFVVELDRRVAIERAIRAAKGGDIVLLAGKGHEKTQTFADGAVHFDDVEEAQRVLREWETKR